HLLPMLWFRNTWSWGYDSPRPELRRVDAPPGAGSGSSSRFALVRATQRDLGELWLACWGAPRLLFTDNETNFQRLWGVPNRTSFAKDGINDAVVRGRWEAVSPGGTGTKMAAHYELEIAPGASQRIDLRLSRRPAGPDGTADEIFAERTAEA